MGPLFVVEFPDTGIGGGPFRFNSSHGLLDGLSARHIELVVAGGRGVKQQGFTKNIQLELPVTQLPTLSVPPG
jgi:hypothetical protein